MSDSVSFVLSIDRVVPDVLIENRRAYIFFSLTNNSERQASGVVSAQLYLGPPSYTPTESTSWPIQLENEFTASGVVAITPPFASKHLALVLQYRESGSIVVQKEISIEIAARFDIGLASFIPKQIRSNDKDTVVGSASLIPANNLSAFSAVSGSASNVIGGGSEKPFPYPPTFMDIDVVPGSEPRNTVLFSYVVLNNGHPISADLLSLLNELSDIGDAVASAFVPGQTMTLVNKRMHDFHQALFDGCDGLLAADRIVLTGRQLVDWTGNVDDHRETREYSGEKAPDFPCQGNVSLYDIVFFVHRQRGPKLSESLYVAPEFSTTQPDGTLIFTTDQSGGGQIDPNVTWSVEGAPDIYGKMANPSFPAYTAPADADWRRLVIIHAVHKDGRKGIAFVRVLPKEVPYVGAIYVDKIPT